MLRCRDGITDLSERLPLGGGNRLLLAHERRELTARCMKMSPHNLWGCARQERGPSAAFLWGEAGVRHAVEGRIDEARPMLRTALGMMNGAAELETRRRLHAVFIKAARRPKGGSPALANELLELAAELIEPVDRDASFRLRMNVISHYRMAERFGDAAYNSMHMAAVIKEEDPDLAELHISYAIGDLREAAVKHERFNKKPDADLEVELGSALHMLAKLMARRGSQYAADTYEDAGDHFRAGEDSMELKADIVGLAHHCYLMARELGGDAARLDNKDAGCRTSGIWY